MFTLPDPLHPAVVHLPIALAVLVPLLAGIAALVIRRQQLPARAWLAVVLLQGILVGSAWMAIETGEAQEDRVERVVAEGPIERHEEGAERFLLAAGVTLALVALGLIPGTAGGVARGVSVAAALGVLAAGVQVGHSGGELVYRHGAASAYTTGTGTDVAASAARRFGHHEDHDDD
jgi:hypothetical protein